MKPRSAPHRIGIVDSGIGGWIGGARYIRMLVRSLGDACEATGVELYLLRGQHHTGEQNDDLRAQLVRLADPPSFRGERRLRRLLGLADRSALVCAARKHQISVLLPLCSIAFRTSDVRTIGWIPDFQHVYLPEFFSEAERRSRDRSFRLLAERCALVMLSSQTALEHFAVFNPEHAHKGRLAPFPSMFAFELSPTDVFATQRKFNLPAKFALVANQFWRHKNHQIVIEALLQLRQQGICPPVVMTGLLSDYRDPNNDTISHLLQVIASAGLADQITILGMVHDADLVNLMRTAALVIQPSRFEGWSTVVQDCKALGRPLICSDIPVHREQAPESLGFFPCDGAAALADLLAATWPGLEPGPDPQTEERSLAAEREFARRHGQSLLRICQEASST
jgi:glycosyltransferase involved in cell wall biosynthesis